MIRLGRFASVVIALAPVGAACGGDDAGETATTTTLSQRAQQVADRSADPDVQAWCALAPEGYVDYEGRGVPYDTFGRYFQNWGDSDATSEALPELLEYERTRMDSAPPEVEDALSEAVNALESYIAELKAGNWDAIALESSHENALAVNPAWKNLAVFEAVYCGETSGTG